MLHIRCFPPVVPQALTYGITDYVYVDIQLKCCNSVYTVCVCIGIACWWEHIYVHDSYVSQRQREKRAEKKVLNKDNLRCLFTIYCHGSRN